MSFAYLFERFPSFVQTFVHREAAEMVRQQMAPWLVSIRRPDDPGDLSETLDLEVFYLPEEKDLRAQVDARRTARQLAWRAHRAIPRHRSERDAQRMFEAIWLAPRLRERGVRHVHAHFGGVAARTAWWLRKLAGIGYSFTGHANDIFCDTDFPVTNAMLVRDARMVITEADFARRWMEKKYPGARGKVFRVFNGMKMDGFPRRDPSTARARIVSVGRYVEKKGFSVLVEACRILRERGRDFECVIAGGGPLREDLQVRIDRAALGDFVRLTGPQPQEEIRHLLASATVFALACVPEAGGGMDNLPTVIAEAMAVGVPVVSTRVAGVPEMIDDGVEGFLVAPSDAPALAEAIGRLLDDPALVARCGAAARNSAVQKFSIETTTRALKHLLVARTPTDPPPAARLADPSMPKPAWSQPLLHWRR